MTLLPNGTEALINDAKIRDYLLNPDNAQNGGKARRFTQYGFDQADWVHLASALKNHPLTNQIATTAMSPHGTKYVVRCNMSTPDQRNPCMVSIWIVENGQIIPRFVTAH